MNGSNQDRFAWAVTEAAFGGAPVELPSGGTLSVVPALSVVSCLEQLARVERKHGRLTAGMQVPVVTQPDGTRHTKWNHLMSKGATE